MAENFYVPYDQIKFFTLKEGGTYRHGLAFRLYLYLCHYNSGRIRWDERKQLVQKFNSSHTAVHKALAYLQEIGFVKLNNKWISAIGHDKTREITKTRVGRNFNIEFSFDLKLLFDRVKFTNHLFLSIFQSSAMIRGKKKALIPQANTNSDGVMLKSGFGDNSTPDITVSNPGFIQRQSSTYLAKMTERHPITVFNRNKKIDAENHYLLNPEPKREKEKGHRTALTVNGFNTREYSQIVGFREFDQASTHLKKLQEKDHSFKPCFVMEAAHGGYVIVKHIPNEYLFSVKTKKEYKNFKEDFSSFQISL